MMTREQAVTHIAEALLGLGDDTPESVASVLLEALERVNVRKVQAGTTAGSGWRQGVQAALYKRI